jgi:hypothetical protein
MWRNVKEEEQRSKEMKSRQNFNKNVDLVSVEGLLQAPRTLEKKRMELMV